MSHEPTAFEVFKSIVDVFWTLWVAFWLYGLQRRIERLEMKR